MNVAQSARFMNDFIVEHGIAERNIFPDSRREQEMILRHIAELWTQVADVIIPEGDVTVCDIFRVIRTEFPQQQCDDCVVARSGCADNGGSLALYSMEV